MCMRVIPSPPSGAFSSFWNSLFEACVCQTSPTPNCDAITDSFLSVYFLPLSLLPHLSLPLPSACPVQPSHPVGGEESSAAPAERGDMGNTQKKPHCKGDGGPHSESSNSHQHGHGKSKGGSSDKYKVPQESKENVANGSNRSASTASKPGDQNKQGMTGRGKTEETVNLDVPCGALPPHLSRLKNEGNLLFKNGQFADALEKYSQAIQGYTDSGKKSSVLTSFLLFWALVFGSLHTEPV